MLQERDCLASSWLFFLLLLISNTLLEPDESRASLARRTADSLLGSSREFLEWASRLLCTRSTTGLASCKLREFCFWKKKLKMRIRRKKDAEVNFCSLTLFPEDKIRSFRLRFPCAQKSLAAARSIHLRKQREQTETERKRDREGFPASLLFSPSFPSPFSFPLNFSTSSALLFPLLFSSLLLSSRFSSPVRSYSWSVATLHSFISRKNIESWNLSSPCAWTTGSSVFGSKKSCADVIVTRPCTTCGGICISTASWITCRGVLENNSSRTCRRLRESQYSVKWREEQEEKEGKAGGKRTEEKRGNAKQGMNQGKRRAE